MAKPIKVEILGDATGFTRALDTASSGLSKLGSLVGTAGLALGGMAAGGLAVATKGLVDLGARFDDVNDNIRVTTGATGAALDELTASFKKVATNFAAPLEDAGVAVANLNQRLQLTGKPLEDLSGQFLDLSRITETDLTTNIDKATRVFGDWNVSVEDMSGTLDELFRATQASGISFDDLTTSLVQFGAPLRNIGFSLQESEALLALFNKTGVNTDTVIAGLKAGVGKLAKAGEDIPTTFERIVKQITDLGPGTEATGLAIELFGQRAGPDLADAITGGKFALDDMLTTITGGSDTITQAADDTADWAEQWQMIKNKVFIALEPLASKLFSTIGDGLDRLQPIFTEITGGITAFQSAWKAADGDVTSSGFPGLMERLANLIRNDLLPALSDLGGSLKTMGETAWPTISAAAEWTLNVFQRMGQFARDHKIVMEGLKVTILGVAVALGAIAIAAAVMTAAAAAAFGAVVIAVAAVVGAVSRLVKYLADQKDIIVQNIKAPFSEGLGWVERKWNDLKSTFTNPFGGIGIGLPGRAMGGPVAMAGLYRVNERSTPGGETVFLPSGSRVQPNYAGGGGGGDTFHIYAPNATPSQVANEIAWRRRMGNGR